MENKKKKILLVVGTVIVCIGVIGILYPLVGNLINSIGHVDVIKEYKGISRELDTTEVNSLIENAEDYNDRLFTRRRDITGLNHEQRQEYNEMLKVGASDVMGYISIPKIDVSLPVYHGTDDSVLQAGIGHIEGSSLPVGGENTNCVLTGHSGLPGSVLFTNLDQLEPGDTFDISVLNETLTYYVEGSEVLLPDAVRLSISPGKDECTLITCTPVGINSHRLVVHAHRITEDEKLQLETIATSKNKRSYGGIVFWIAVSALTVLSASFVIIYFWRKRGVK